MRARVRYLVLGLIAVLFGAVGCAGAGALGGSGKSLAVAIIANPQMGDAVTLSHIFEEKHPGIDIKFVKLPENEARAKVTASVSTQSGQFDIVMISNYEARQWAGNGWLSNLEPYMRDTPGYDKTDFISSIRDSLTYRGNMYAVPFYGESSFLVYRKDLFAKAGLTMPEHPSWQQVAKFAKKLDDPEHDVIGICLRGQPGWGESLAPLDTVINTFGARWFDKDWHAKLTSPAFEKAVSFYVNLVQKYGEIGAASTGFSGCSTRYAQGQAAMWYDATSMTSTVESPDSSKVVGKNGYAAAPTVKTKYSGWLYSWALAIPTTSPQKKAAWKFMSWMTDKHYMKLVGKKLGWSHVPPGSRQSTYDIPQYAKIAGAYAKPTLRAIAHAKQKYAMTKPVPYYGIQFLGIPEFQDLGTRVSQQIAAAIAGRKSVHQALVQAQHYAEVVGTSYREQR